MTREDARNYNIKWRIFKYYITFLDANFNDTISIEILTNHDDLQLREKDVTSLKSSDWITLNDKIFHLEETGTTQFKSWWEKKIDIEATHKSEKEKLFAEMKHNYQMMKNEFAHTQNYEKIEQYLKDAISQAVILHWLYLPEYEEFIMENRGVFPDDTEKYYDHYHTIEDFVNYGEGHGKKISKLGDVNLNKEMKFKVYSRRWGHYDTYSIYRTDDGWKIDNATRRGKTQKNGEGALISNFQNDSIYYPESLMFTMEQLWELADQTPMEVSELQEYLNQIAEWVSITTQNVPRFLSEHSIL